jgi:hypothetical protein
MLIVGHEMTISSVRSQSRKITFYSFLSFFIGMHAASEPASEKCTSEHASLTVIPLSYAVFIVLFSRILCGHCADILLGLCVDMMCSLFLFHCLFCGSDVLECFLG